MTNSVYLKIREINRLNAESQNTARDIATTESIATKLQEDIATKKSAIQDMQMKIGNIKNTIITAELSDIIDEVKEQYGIEDATITYSTGIDFPTATSFFAEKNTNDFNRDKGTSENEVPVRISIDYSENNFRMKFTTFTVNIGLQEKQLDGKTFAEHVTAETYTQKTRNSSHYGSKIKIDDLSQLIVRTPLNSLLIGSTESGFKPKDKVSSAMLYAADTFNRKNNLEADLTL